MKIAYPLIVLALTACAGADVRPVVDMQGVNSTKYEADLRDCQEYAKQNSPIHLSWRFFCDPLRCL